MKEKKSLAVQRRQIDLAKEIEEISAQEEKMDYERQLQLALSTQKSDLDLQLQQALKGQKFEFDAKITKMLKDSTNDRNKIVYEFNILTSEKHRMEDELRDIEMKTSHLKADYERRIRNLREENEMLKEEWKSKLVSKENELREVKERAEVAIANAEQNNNNHDEEEEEEDDAQAAVWEEHISELEAELKELTSEKLDQKADFEARIKALSEENRKLADEREIKLEQKEEEFLERSTERDAINVTSERIKSLESELRDSNKRSEQQRDHYEAQITALEDRSHRIEGEWEIKLVRKEQDLINAKEQFLKRNEEEDAATAALIATSTIELEKELCISEMKLSDVEEALRKVERERELQRKQNSAEKQELEKEIEFLEEEMISLKENNSQQHRKQWNGNNNESSFRR